MKITLLLVKLISLNISQENLEDKHLSRFLEAEGIVHENQDDLRKGAASG